MVISFQRKGCFLFERLLLLLMAGTMGLSGCSDSSDTPDAIVTPGPAASESGSRLATTAEKNDAAASDSSASDFSASAESASSTTTTEPQGSAATPTLPSVAETAESTPAKSAKAPIYLEEANGKELIAAALRRAQRDHKHVLIEWGGNWCGWCYKLHDVFHNDSLVQPIVHEEFELVLIDQGQNNELMLEYGGADRQYSFPHLTVLDADGKVLTNQETGSLETGPKHEPKLVAEFLQKWTPAKLDAEQLLSNALATAASEDKSVLVRVGSPYCGWCTILAQFMQDRQTLFAADFVDLKIDTMRMVSGKEVAERLEPEGAGGIPWMVILDASGKTVATSIGPNGNIGYPYQPEEIAHFIEMLKTTRRKLTDADLEAIAADLTAYREAREKKP